MGSINNVQWHAGICAFPLSWDFCKVLFCFSRDESNAIRLVYLFDTFRYAGTVLLRTSRWKEAHSVQSTLLMLRASRGTEFSRHGTEPFPESRQPIERWWEPPFKAAWELPQHMATLCKAHPEGTTQGYKEGQERAGAQQDWSPNSTEKTDRTGTPQSPSTKSVIKMLLQSRGQ